MGLDQEFVFNSVAATTKWEVDMFYVLQNNLNHDQERIHVVLDELGLHSLDILSFSGRVIDFFPQIKFFWTKPTSPLILYTLMLYMHPQVNSVHIRRLFPRDGGRLYTFDSKVA